MAKIRVMNITLLNDDLLDEWLAANEASRGIGHVSRLLRFWQEMLDGRRLIFTAWDKEIFLGHITLQPQSEYPPFRKQNIPEIVDVWVQPLARRKGIAQKLLNVAMKEAKKYDVPAIGMGVGITPEYGAAHVLYGKNGFAPDGSGLWVMGAQAGEHETITLGPEAIMMWVKKIMSDYGDDEIAKPAKKERKEIKPRKLTESYFYNSAVFYLQRYSSTAAGLKRVLERKVLRNKMRGGEVPDEVPQWIDKAVEKCVTLKFIDDKVFTEQKINSLRRQGRSNSVIASTLQQKGVEKEMLHEMLQSSPETELEAAIRTVKRKRLGKDETPEGRQKDLAKLCRAGFSLDVARRALSNKV